MLLPRALAIRKTAGSSAANRPSAPSARPNQQLIHVDTKPQQSEISAEQLIKPSATNGDNGIDTSSNLTLSAPYPRSLGSLRSPNLTKSYQSHASQERNKTRSIHFGCVVWLNGLPITQKITKPLIKALVWTMRNEVLQEKSIDHLSASSEVKYVDFTKGLANCHIRFASASLADQFVQLLNSFSESKNPIVLAILGQKIDCSQLEALVISGRREEIYLKKIPDYLH